MSYKQNDFLIGISELVSILLPGALASYILLPTLEQAARSHGLPQLPEAGNWVAFILLSYFLGHLIFLVGAWLDKPYDLLRQRFRPREKDKAYAAATAVAKAMLEDAFEATNTYKFATALLSLRHEAAAAEVRQFEADSKFFRSLTVLMGLLLVLYWGDLNTKEVAIVGLLLVACFWRYLERRWKSTRRAFEYVVTVAALPTDKDAA